MAPIASRRSSRSGRACFGVFVKNVAAGLQLRHDHGSQYVSHHFQSEIRFLGIESSPAFVREPEGPVSCADVTPWDRAEPDGCAERFIRVLKENLLWVRRFDTVEELLACHPDHKLISRIWYKLSVGGTRRSDHHSP